MADKKKHGGAAYVCYRIVYRLVALFYPKTEVVGVENLPDEPCIIVGNHAQMNGPIVGELYFPGERCIWCAGQMMHLKEVPAYAFEDFWSGKPKAIRWFYKLLSYIIAPLSVAVFNNAHTIGVYHDTRIITTFRQTMAAMDEGKNIIIFPECAQKNNNIVNQFQERFVSVAKFYYKRTGKALQFVPMYLAPRLKTAYLGEPVTFDPAAENEPERHRICQCLSRRITAMAVSLPPHTVVPYNNISKKLYPVNTPSEVTPSHEKTHN